MVQDLKRTLVTHPGKIRISIQLANMRVINRMGKGADKNVIIGHQNLSLRKSMYTAEIASIPGCEKWLGKVALAI